MLERADRLLAALERSGRRAGNYAAHDACEITGPSQWEQAKARTMDETTRGVQTVDSPRISEDTRVAEEVARKLAASGRFPPGRVQVTSSDGVVKLRGRVGSYYQKQVMQEAARTVAGARQVINEVDVT
jgi:osmotically-inducible protein OsmY